jgi:hypothetical protein
MQRTISVSIQPPAGPNLPRIDVAIVCVVAVLAVFGVITLSIARWMEPADTAVRVIASVALLSPAGLS